MYVAKFENYQLWVNEEFFNEITKKYKIDEMGVKFDSMFAHHLVVEKKDNWYKLVPSTSQNNERPSMQMEAYWTLLKEYDVKFEGFIPQFYKQWFRNRGILKEEVSPKVLYRVKYKDGSEDYVEMNHRERMTIPGGNIDFIGGMKGLKIPTGKKLVPYEIVKNKAKKIKKVKENTTMKNLKLREIIREEIKKVLREQTESEIDGKDKETAKRYIYKKITPLTKGIFKDDSWEGVNKIWKEFEKMNLQWNTTKATYTHAKDGSIGWNTPTGKIWNFEIEFHDKQGKIKKIYGSLHAAGAGSVEDPLDRYDITVVLS